MTTLGRLWKSSFLPLLLSLAELRLPSFFISMGCVGLGDKKIVVFCFFAMTDCSVVNSSVVEASVDCIVLCTFGR